MPDNLLKDDGGPATEVHALTADMLEAWCESAGERVAAWVAANGYKADAGKVLLVPGEDGTIRLVLLGLGRGEDAFASGALPGAVPKGRYRLTTKGAVSEELAALGLALGNYRYDRYKKNGVGKAEFLLPESVDRDEVAALAEATYLVRDLVNTPASDLGPEELEAVTRELADAHGAEVSSIVGDDLLAADYPMVHAVGRASSRAPRLIDLRWGPESAPKITLVGKGVCFDTGGLNLKPGNSMGLMKKDMGGAAHVLALAGLLMKARLNIRLRVLVPAVENAIGGDAFRPGDVLPSRKGFSVEIGNTDAEGRLILADALTEADSEEPALLVDMATLTGAARVALGPELPPFFTRDDGFARELEIASAAVADPVWRLPLWAPYDSWLDSKVADVSHISDGPFAGSITAALFLARFVEKAQTYAHFDIYAWNAKPRPGRPVGGEAQAIRALYFHLKRHYA